MVGCMPFVLVLKAIAQHQLLRVRLEVMLAHDVGIGMTPEMVLQERNGHDQGDLPVPVVSDQLNEFRLVVAIDLLLEKTHDMLQDIAVKL